MRRVDGGSSASSAEVNWVLTTSDGANIAVTEHASLPGVEVLFSAASGGKYAYLNNVTAWTQSNGIQNGAESLEYWRVG